MDTSGCEEKDDMIEKLRSGGGEPNRANSSNPPPSSSSSLREVCSRASFSIDSSLCVSASFRSCSWSCWWTRGSRNLSVPNSRLPFFSGSKPFRSRRRSDIDKEKEGLSGLWAMRIDPSVNLPRPSSIFECIWALRRSSGIGIGIGMGMGKEELTVCESRHCV